MRMIQHMGCRRVKEREIEFDSHLSGFVYKVRVNGEVLIKKEIPGPDTVDEFLYEINALNRLRFANNVIQFYGVIVDDKEEQVKGLLISYAEQGALIDVLYDGEHSLPWNTREKWARQIVNGLAEIHEAGFVQGDFTLSNIVVNDEGDAKIIDINRRGCPVGWEPPEATPLIESNQRISMYIGVKSDLFQLGMVLWALATQEDEPEAHGRPLRIGSDLKVPAWYRRIVDICLSEDPRHRIQALHLLSMFPDVEESEYGNPNESSASVDRNSTRPEYFGEFGGSPIPEIRTVQPPHDWAYVGWGNRFSGTEDRYSYPARGRSPPSPMPSDHRGRGFGSPRYGRDIRSWSDNRGALTAPSVSDVPQDEAAVEAEAHRGAKDTMGASEDETYKSIPALVAGDRDGAAGAGTAEREQGGHVKQHSEPIQTQATADKQTATLDSSTTPYSLAQGPEAAPRISRDVSEKPKPNSDGDEAGKTGTATRAEMVSGTSNTDKEEEQKSLSSLPTSQAGGGKKDLHVSEVQKLVEGFAESLAPGGAGGAHHSPNSYNDTKPPPLPFTDDANKADREAQPAAMNSSDRIPEAGTTTTELPSTTETSSRISQAAATSSSLMMQGPSFPDALTGIGSAHDFNAGNMDKVAGLIPEDDDEFGIGSFAKENLLENAITTTEAAGVTNSTPAAK